MFTYRKLLRKVLHRQYYYHVSPYPILKCNRIGKRILLRPLDSTEVSGRGLCEPMNSRICVAPTIQHCLSSIYISPNAPFIYVYQTCHPVLARYPYGVADSRVTREKWLIYPTWFKLVRIINPSLIHGWPRLGMDPGISGYSAFQKQRKYQNKIKRILDIHGMI